MKKICRCRRSETRRPAPFRLKRVRPGLRPSNPGTMGTVDGTMVVASLAFVIHESANPHIAVLGRLPGTTIYRNTQQYPESYTYSGIVIVRVDAPIYFANISYIREWLQELVVSGKRSAVGGPDAEKVHFVIIEMDPVTYIDSSAVQALKDLHYVYKSHSVQLAVVNPNHKVWKRLTISGVLELVGKEWHFVRVHDAVQVCLEHMLGLKETPRGADMMRKDENVILEVGAQNNGDLDPESGEALV